MRNSCAECGRSCDIFLLARVRILAERFLLYRKLLVSCKAKNRPGVLPRRSASASILPVGNPTHPPVVWNSVSKNTLFPIKIQLFFLLPVSLFHKYLLEILRNFRINKTIFLTKSRNRICGIYIFPIVIMIDHNT